jgi:hypothetical protein
VRVELLEPDAANRHDHDAGTGDHIPADDADGERAGPDDDTPDGDGATGPDADGDGAGVHADDRRDVIRRRSR